eukprot:jgi/Chrpa1/2156/Chrysochromulina_OHIO_Genome00009270-RA
MEVFMTSSPDRSSPLGQLTNLQPKSPAALLQKPHGALSRPPRTITKTSQLNISLTAPPAPPAPPAISPRSPAQEAAYKLLCSSVALAHAQREMLHRELRVEAIRSAVRRQSSEVSPTSSGKVAFWPSAGRFAACRLVPLTGTLLRFELDIGYNAGPAVDGAADGAREDLEEKRRPSAKATAERAMAVAMVEEMESAAAEA